MNAAPSSAIKTWQVAFDQQQDVNATQRQAFEAFQSRGLPTAKVDAWKYTDLRRLNLRQFGLPSIANEATGDASGSLLKGFGKRYLFIDGVAQQLTQDSGVHDQANETFELLNSAFSPAALSIDLSDEREPVYLAFVWTSKTNGVMHHPRIHVTLGNHAKATLVEHHVGSNSEANFSNSVLNIQVGEQASLEHIRVQEDAVSNFNVNTVRTQVARGGRYLSYQYVLGGGLARSNIHIELQGAEAHTELHGLVFARQTQHLDVRSVVNHQVANTTSVEDYRGIADQRGRVVFNGKVIVAKDAQRIDAKQSSRNLLLSPTAEIDTRPELEIYANDVKCAHGATVGQLDATALFYLQSRGIALREARALLTHAFAAELIERIPVESVREHVLARLNERMRSEVSP